MTDLTNAPNIGKVCAELLKQSEINSLEELKAVGSEQAFLRIQAIDPTACISMLCALEGAVQGIRWHQLPLEKKQKLKEFFKMTKKKP